MDNPTKYAIAAIVCIMFLTVGAYGLGRLNFDSIVSNNTTIQPTSTTIPITTTVQPNVTLAGFSTPIVMMYLLPQTHDSATQFSVKYSSIWVHIVNESKEQDVMEVQPNLTQNKSSNLTQNQSNSTQIIQNGTLANTTITNSTSIANNETAANNTNSSEWVNVTGDLFVDYSYGLNVGKYLGRVDTEPGMKIDMVRFNVTLAEVQDGLGIAHNATLINQTFTAPVYGNQMIGNNSTVLIEAIPVYSELYNSTSTSFVLQTVGKAIVVSDPYAYLALNGRASLPINESLTNALNAAGPNISISSALLSTTKGVTYVDVAVNDKSNSNATLTDLLLSGPFNLTTKGPLPILQNSTTYAGNPASFYRKATFLPSQNGTLSLARSVADFTNSSGTDINQGSSAVLTYTGKLSYISGAFQALTVSGYPYTIFVIGKNGAFATVNVTG